VQNSKEADNLEGRRLGGSRQKETMNDTVDSESVGGFQYFKRKDNEETDGFIV
jgi:hypothetical protein